MRFKAYIRYANLHVVDIAGPQVAEIGILDEG